MINDPKIGDVVTLDPANPAGWECYLGKDQWLVTEVKQSKRYCGDGWTTPVTLRSLRGRKIYGEVGGVWACYLNRNEFLTAARQAIKQSRKRVKRAPRTETAA